MRLDRPGHDAAETGEVPRRDAMAPRFGESLALYDAGKTSDALAVDLTTNGISAQINRFEQRLGLVACP